MAIGDNIVWFGRYEGWLRWLCRGVRGEDPECIDRAARLFDLMLPAKRCAIVPMPSHLGYATAMNRVAYRVAEMSGYRMLTDSLTCDPHEASYAQKKAGRFPDRITMRIGLGVAEGLREMGRQVFIIDNVVCTGVTAAAALEAFRAKGVEAKVCTLARAVWR